MILDFRLVRGFLVALLITGTVAMTGCGNKEEAPTPAQTKGDLLDKAISNNTSMNPIAAPGEYLKSAVRGHQDMIKTIDVTSINSSIQQFYAMEGRYPKDLNELISTHYLSKMPPEPNGMKIVYDAKAGQVTLEKQ